MICFSWWKQSKCCLKVSPLVLTLNNKPYTEAIPHSLLPVAKSCLTLCDPMDCGMTVFPTLHHLPEPAQTHLHRVSDAIQPSHPLSSPSPAFNLSGSSRPRFPDSQSLPPGSLHMPLILIHQRADRRSKNYNPTVYRTKATITES